MLILIIKIENELLHINCWGGVNTVAQALWKFRKNHPDAFNKNISKAIDPDGDKVYYWWWHYPDPSGMNNPIKIVHETSDNARFVVSENSKNDIHFILEVSDDGSPQLKSYKRLIFKMEK